MTYNLSYGNHIAKPNSTFGKIKIPFDNSLNRRISDTIPTRKPNTTKKPQQRPQLQSRPVTSTAKMTVEQVIAKNRRTVTRTPTMVRNGIAVGAIPRTISKTISPMAIPKDISLDKVRTVKSDVVRAFPAGIVFTAIVFTIIFMFIIFSIVQINEYTNDVSNLQSQVSALAQKEKDLTLELGKKNDLRIIEQIATEKLGMVKKDQLPKKYVNIDSEDKIEVAKKDESTKNKSVSTFITSVSENIMKFKEYID